MLKCHLKCVTARWDGQRSSPHLSQRVRSSTADWEGKDESSRQLNGRDMRQTVRVTDKQPRSLGATGRQKHCLAVDNKPPPHTVIAARPMADPPETSILCHLKPRASV